MPETSTLKIIDAFNLAFNHHDVDAMMALMTDDCIFENTAPFPDGTRYEGQQAVRAFWEVFFRNSPDARIDFEEIIALDERCFQRWTYHWIDEHGTAGHIRGVDIFRLREG
ncbi:MAG TPA: nuclear transport factor 2 family protein, partial [Phototrophicaceae bacterium]|nr:nuclear transport factor 2 family protein [Phototrophicaceae bacterium]